MSVTQGPAPTLEIRAAYNPQSAPGSHELQLIFKRQPDGLERVESISLSDDAVVQEGLMKAYCQHFASSRGVMVFLMIGRGAEFFCTD